MMSRDSYIAVQTESSFWIYRASSLNSLGYYRNFPGVASLLGIIAGGVFPSETVRKNEIYKQLPFMLCFGWYNKNMWVTKLASHWLQQLKYTGRLWLAHRRLASLHASISWPTLPTLFPQIPYDFVRSATSNFSHSRPRWTEPLVKLLYIRLSAGRSSYIWLTTISMTFTFLVHFGNISTQDRAIIDAV